MHGSARLTVAGRLLLCQRVVDDGWTIGEAAEAVGVSRQTGCKWVGRYRREGLEGLRDRSTRPHRSPRKVSAKLEAKIRKAREQLGAGPHVLSWLLGIARSTIYAVLRRLGISRLPKLGDAHRGPSVRYEWPKPGDMIHLDTKKLGRIAPGAGKRFHGPRGARRGIGCNFVHLAIDDHSRLGYAEELADETGATAAAFLERALGFFARHGFTVRRVLTDNGGCYKSTDFLQVCHRRRIKVRKTKAYRPQTNGKAEAFVKILLRGWAYRRPYYSTAHRIRALPPFLDDYNHRRPHGGLDGARPIDRVSQ